MAELHEAPHKESLVDSTASQIVSYVLDHSLQPGDRLPNEETLTELLRVGRGTLREAVRQLCSRNILKTIRGSGTYVSDRTGIPDDPLGFMFAEDSVKLAYDLIECRMMIEPGIAALAAIRCTEQDRRDLRLVEEKVSSLRTRGGDYRNADLEFHCKIAEISKNDVLKVLLPILSKSIIFSRDVQVEEYATLTLEQTARITNAAHKSIVNAICRGDSEGARSAMVGHLNHSREYYRKALEAHLEEI